MLQKAAYEDLENALSGNQVETLPSRPSTAGGSSFKQKPGSKMGARK